MKAAPEKLALETAPETAATLGEQRKLMKRHLPIGKNVVTVIDTNLLPVPIANGCQHGSKIQCLSQRQRSL